MVDSGSDRAELAGFVLSLLLETMVAKEDRG